MRTDIVCAASAVHAAGEDTRRAVLAQSFNSHVSRSYFLWRAGSAHKPQRQADSHAVEWDWSRALLTASRLHLKARHHAPSPQPRSCVLCSRSSSLRNFCVRQCDLMLRMPGLGHMANPPLRIGLSYLEPRAKAAPSTSRAAHPTHRLRRPETRQKGRLK